MLAAFQVKPNFESVEVWSDRDLEYHLRRFGHPHRRQFESIPHADGCIAHPQLGQLLICTLPSISDRFRVKCAASRQTCRGGATARRKAAPQHTFRCRWHLVSLSEHEKLTCYQRCKPYPRSDWRVSNLRRTPLQGVPGCVNSPLQLGRVWKNCAGIRQIRSL